MSSSYVRAALKRTAEGEKKGKTTFTATDTGARKEALRRIATGKNRDYGRYVEKMVKGGIRGGIVPESASQGDIEEMIRRDSGVRSRGR